MEPVSPLKGAPKAPEPSSSTPGTDVWLGEEQANGASAGAGDGFIAKYASDGSREWIAQFGSASTDDALAVAVDEAGNAFIAGYTAGSLPGHTHEGMWDAFLIKYDTSGAQLWIEQFGGGDRVLAQGVAIAPNGDAILTGYTSGALPGHTNAGAYDAFVTRYDTSGARLWVTQFGTGAHDVGYAVAVNDEGRAYATGETGGAMPGTTHSGGYDFFITELDPDGAIRRHWQHGGAGYDIPTGIGTDAHGSVYAAGGTDQELEGTTTTGADDVIIVRAKP